MVAIKRKPGRPKGSKNKPKSGAGASAATMPGVLPKRKPGRPKGSRNKPKTGIRAAAAATSRAQSVIAPARSNRLAIYKLVPNMMTLAALSMGMTSIQYAIDGRWERAVIFIVIAAFIDAFDGAAARLLKATSKLGAELDTLSDFLCFGVAPATVMYLWLLQDAGKFGWMIAVVFAIATGLRLARFNTEEKDKNKELLPSAKKKAYFTGVPAPTGAGMALLPLIISIHFSHGSDRFETYTSSPQWVALWMLLFAILMVSRMPTFSTKQVRLHPKLVVPLLGAFGLLIAGLIHATWITLIIMGVVYGVSIPLAAWVSWQESKAAKAR